MRVTSEGETEAHTDDSLLRPLRLGAFALREVPAGWSVLESIGLRADTEPLAQCSIVAMADALDAHAATLEAYVEKQIAALAAWVEGIQTAAMLPRPIAGAERVLGLQVRLPGDESGVLVQDQIYALHAGAVGILTLTAPERAAEVARGAFDAIVAGLRFVPDALSPATSA